MSYTSPRAFQHWSNVDSMSAAATGPATMAMNRQGHTGLLQFSHSGGASAMTCQLFVRHLDSGSYKAWPCQDMALGTVYAASAVITTTDLLTLAFDARDLNDVELVRLTGSANFYWGHSAADPTPPYTISTAVTQSTNPWIVSGTVGVAGTPTWTHGKTIKTVAGSATGDVDLISAVASKRLKVMAYSFIAVDNTGQTLSFKSSGTGGAEIWRVYLKGPDANTPYGANLSVPAPSFLFATSAGHQLTLDTSSSGLVHYSVSYYDDDAS